MQAIPVPSDKLILMAARDAASGRILLYVVPCSFNCTHKCCTLLSGLYNGMLVYSLHAQEAPLFVHMTCFVLQQTPCALAESEAGVSFATYYLYFYRQRDVNSCPDEA